MERARLDAMNRALVGICLTLFVLDLARHGVQALMEAIDRGKSKRIVADARSTAGVLEQYRAATGAYPKGMSARELAAAVSPTYVRSLPVDELRYWSDGSHYTLILSMRSGGYESVHGPIEVRDGALVSWPKALEVPVNLRLVGAAAQ